VPCDRHPRAVAHGGLCPACLIEAALSADLVDGETARRPAADRTTGTRRLTVCLPLGATARASVFLVREGAASPRLLRLKVWHAPASPGFLERFDDLRIRLERWRGSPIALPLAASLDPAGCPAVLSEFRQGVPILDAVHARSVNAGSALTLIRPVIDVLLAAHEEGLGHGALVSGNVLLELGSGSTHVLDFGLTALLDARSDPAALRLADRNGLAALSRAARGVRRTRPLRPGL
jgi:hypothetical protein